MDPGNSGRQRGLLAKSPWAGTIIVPFAPESELSGIEHIDFMNAVWYRRTVTIPEAWAGQSVHLHFGAVDYEATVWVNGTEVYRHRGGFTSFTCHLDGVAAPGETAVIVVRARDLQSEPKPSGKQSIRYENFGCFYTRTTGIWQTVWLEPVPPVSMKRPRITPHVERQRFSVEVPLSRNPAGYTLRGRLFWQGEVVAEDTVGAARDFAPMLELNVPDTCLHLWGPGEGNLYDIELALLNPAGKVVDEARSYAGLRSVSIEGKMVKINGRTIFQRQVLDQGIYPDSLMTAPTDQAFIDDIQLTLDAGFNTARICQKVFEERYHYHADRMGLMTWAEFADWGMWGQQAQIAPKDHNPYASAIAQWAEALDRDYSHPSIIGWCGICEGAPPTGRADQMTSHDDLLLGIFHAAKAIDKTRPVLDTSGFVHRIAETDVLDTHEYEQDPQKLDKILRAGLGDIRQFYQSGQSWPWVQRGQPFFVSEFGGIKWHADFAEDDPAQQESWGYGEPPRSIEEFYERLESQCRVILNNPWIFGFCYTQLTDTFQEQNGIVYFDRSAKFDLQRIRAAFSQPAAIEA